jgi:hypothetical protein
MIATVMMIGGLSVTLLRDLAVAALACLALPAFAQDHSDEDKAAAMDFAMHDAVFTLYHEGAHLLVGELGLPVLGREEDAADALAVILILQQTEDEDEMYNTLIDSAEGWYMEAQTSTGEGIEDLSYYDEHSLDIQRAYAVVCMIVGARPEVFAEIADSYEMEPERQEDCGPVYGQAEDSWMTLLEPHMTETAGDEIAVTYDDAGEYQHVADALKERGLLEGLGEMLSTSFTLPGPVTLHARQCGESNAHYDPELHEIVYCYELGDEKYRTWLEAPADEAE